MTAPAKFWPNPHGHLFKRREHDENVAIWREIMMDNDWAQAYMPYDDEPTRDHGTVFCQAGVTDARRMGAVLRAHADKEIDLLERRANGLTSRNRLGESRFTEADALHWRQLYEDGGLTIREIADQEQVAATTVAKLLHSVHTAMRPAVAAVNKVR